MEKTNFLNELFNVEDKIALVTGGGSGIGKIITEALAFSGSKVYITSRKLEIIKNTSEEINSKKPKYHVEYFCSDLSSERGIEELVNSFQKNEEHLNILVNNSGVSWGSNLGDFPYHAWDRVMKVNVRGTWLMSKAAVPHLAKSRAGKIVNIASDTALWGAPRLMHYVASKGAVLSMTRSMARELGESGIAVNSIAPGLTEVEATEYVPQDRKDLYVSNRPFNRVQMPNDVTGAVMFLISDAASFITGQCIPVNGGFLMR